MTHYIVACGGVKRSVPSRADELYVGQYFETCLRYARRCVPDDRIRILSAKWGLLELDREIDPYDLRLGEKGAVWDAVVHRQALNEGITDVVVLGGKDYVELCRSVWGENCTAPFHHPEVRNYGSGCQVRDMLKFINKQKE